ncbi:MAG: hypothetical protein IT374_26610 [Polyangiaceae bacterium]|nr:hypothetical protein [Polyangiaceae bacterium]
MPAPSHLVATPDGDVVVGTLFSWRQSADAPRVGEFRAEHGQLLWVAKQGAERGFAVLLDGRQVHVREVEELLDGRPARLRVGLSLSPRAVEVIRAELALPTLLECAIGGTETVEAQRATA